MTARAMLAAIAAILGFSAAAPLHAQSVGDKESVTLDPSASYIIVQNSSASSMYSFPITFIRRPEPVEVEDYRHRRAEALVKAHAKWARRHADWEKALASWQALSPEHRKSGGIKRPVEPVEPTDLNLAFPSLDSEQLHTIGPFNRFSKANGRSTFVEQVRPGRYAFYGPAFVYPTPAGTCMCMGSFEFEVKPGQIVHAGMMTLNFLDMRKRAKDEGRPVPKNEFELPETMTSIGWEAPVAGVTIDPRLAAYTIVPADLRPVAGFPNYFGITIDRVTAIPGILEYDGEKSIDPRAVTQSTAAAAPTP